MRLTAPTRDAEARKLFASHEWYDILKKTVYALSGRW